MRPRTIGMLIVALLLAGIAARLIQGRLHHPAQEAAKPPPPPPAVLVAAKNLAPGAFLQASDLRWQDWPVGGLASGYAVRGKAHLKDFIGRVPRVTLAVGQPVTVGATVAPGDHGFLAAALRPGMRAISVPITNSTGLNGLVSPGDWIDLVLTESFTTPQVSGTAQIGSVSANVQMSQSQRHASLTVLRDIRVLAVNRNLNPIGWNPGPTAGKNAAGHADARLETATLEATPEDIERIAVAETMGNLSLTLRSLGAAESLVLPSLPAPGIVTPRNMTLASWHGLTDIATLDPMSAPNLADRTTFTVDSSVSPLLPPFPSLAQKHIEVQSAEKKPTVTILRGGSGTPTNGGTK